MISKLNQKSWPYGVASLIFFLVAVINFWMIIDDGATIFRAIATTAFAIGGILLLAVFLRVSKTGS
jgi:hypothetical protein